MNGKNVFCVLLLAVSSGILAWGDNLIRNPGFENDLEDMWRVPGWVWKAPQGKRYFSPQIDRQTSQGPVGTRSLKFSATKEKNVTWCPMLEGKRQTLPPGVKAFTLAMWVKSEMLDAKAGNYGILEFFATCQGKDKPPLTVTLRTPWNKALPDWTLITENFTLPEGYETYSLLLKFSGNKDHSFNFWVDNLYFGPQWAKAGKDASTTKPATLIRMVHHDEHEGIYYPGEPITYELHFRKLIQPGQRAQLLWTIRDFDGRKLGKGRQDIALERRVDVTLPLPKTFMGWFEVKAEVMADGYCVGTTQASGFRIERQTVTPDPFFSTRGCASHEKHVRIGLGPKILTPGGSITWAMERPTKGQYDFSLTDQFLRHARKQGYTNLYANTSFTNYLLSPGYKRKAYNDKLKQGTNPFTDEDFEDYRKFAKTAIARYGQYISSWRVPDEIGLCKHHNPFAVTQYHRFCKIFSEELKKQFPNAKLYAGGTMFGDPSEASLKTVIWDKIKDHVDGLCVDMYPHGVSVGVGMNYLGPEQCGLRQRYLRTFKATGCKEFVNEETGSAFQRDLPLDHPALKDYAVINARMITVGKSLDQIKGWTHFMIEDSPSAWNGNFDYGAWKNFNPRPHAYTLALVCRELAYARHAIEIKPHADIYAYVFERRGKTLLALWAMSKEGIEATIPMPSDWKGRTVIGQPVAGKKGPSKLTLTDRPYYLELSAPQKEVANAVAKGHYMLPAIAISINRKFGDRVNVFIKNKLNHPIEAEASLNGSPSKRMTIPKQARIPVEFSAKPGKLNAEVIVDKVRYKYARQEELHEVERLDRPPAFDGTLAGLESVKPLVFDKSDVLFPIDAGAWGYWTGPKDLSAKLYLAYDNQYVYVAADVMDSIQISRCSGSDIWNQDCVQYAFDTENDSFDPQTSIAGYHADDREFCMALTPKGPQNYCYTGSPDIAQRLVEDTIQVTRKDGHTRYLARIPWRYFGKLSPVSGSVFGFNVVFFDLDQKTGAIPYRMELSPGIANGKAPAHFKRFILK